MTRTRAARSVADRNVERLVPLARRQPGVESDYAVAVRRSVLAAARRLSAESDADFSSVYPALRRAAARMVRGRSGLVGWEPADLAHEAYIRLARKSVDWRDRERALAIGAMTMRMILIESSPGRCRTRAPTTVPLAARAILEAPGVDVVDIADAVTRLAEKSPQAAKVVDHRIFGGLSSSETATALGVPLRTVEREWHFALAWLRKEMS